MKLKSIGWQAWAIVAMACVILVLLFFPKSCGVDNLEDKVSRYEDYITQKQAEANVLRAKALRLEKKLRADSINRIASEKAYIAKISALEKKVKEKRKLADPIIEKNDILKQWAAAVDSVNAAKDARINELKEEARIQGLVCRDLLSAQVKELAIAWSIDADKDVIIKAQAKTIRKLKAGRVLRNVVIPVALVGGFILGVQAD